MPPRRTAIHGVPPAPEPEPYPELNELLRETFHALKRRQLVVLRERDLSYSEWAALHLCAQGPARGNDLAESAGLTSAGVTDVVDRLERRGLVRRARDPTDRRAMRVELTEAGRRLHLETGGRVRALLAELVGRLAPEELRALETGLRALNRAELERTSPAPPAA